MIYFAVQVADAADRQTYMQQLVVNDEQDRSTGVSGAVAIQRA